MIKKIVKIFMVMLLLISTVQFLNVFDVSAKSIKFSGVYKKNSKKAKYYLELRQYDMPDDSGFVGNYWFVPKKAGYVEHHEEFKKKAKNMYVDKCGILNYTNSVLGSTDAFICNSRPRRFGKSVTANMLTAYYSKGCDSEEMFSRLEISQAEDFRKHLNQYDVIHWDIQWCMGPANGPEKVVSYISEKTISELREYYPDVLPAENHSLAETLARINTVTGRKFIVIIDEWDVLIRDEAAKEDIQNEYIRFLRGIFKGTEPTKYIQLAYLTGILPIKKEKTQSALNNFDEFTMVSPSILAQYIGFTEAEVQKLSDKYHQDFVLVMNWFDGFMLID